MSAKKAPSAKTHVLTKKPAPGKTQDVPCPHYEECGACPLMENSYSEQLRIKQERVRKAYREAGFSADLLQSVLKPAKGSPKTIGYRNKAKWILEPSPEGLQMGIYYPGTHRVVDIPHCSVHAPEINKLSEFLKHELNARQVACGHHEKNAPAHVRYIIVRYSFREKKLLVVFVTSASRVNGLEGVIDAIKREFADKVVAVVQNINDDEGNVLLGEANRFWHKSSELTETFGRFRVPVGPLSFLQVNSLQASYLYQRVRTLIGGGPFEAGLDLYSGVGLFALHMSSTTKKILAVEDLGPAALEAMTAARRNRAKNILQLCSDAHDGISTFQGEWGSPDWVVLNPPRKGCEEAVIKALAEKPPFRLAYVSCNPVTQARDIALLMEENPDLQLKTIEPVDMFPQTEHVECIVLLENRSFSKATSAASPKGPARQGLH